MIPADLRTTNLYLDSLNSYTRRLREELGLEEAPILSPLGLHLLLSLYGAGLPKAQKEDLAEVLNAPPETLRNSANELLKLALRGTPNRGGERAFPLQFAAGAWQKGELPYAYSLPLDPCPPKTELDNWAQLHTDNMVKSFPINPDLWDDVLLFATAILAKTGWIEGPLPQTPEGHLKVQGNSLNFAGTFESESAGLLAVAAPKADFGLMVLSVSGGDGVTPRALWRGVEETVSHLLRGGKLESPKTDGHSWTAEEDPSGDWNTVVVPQWKQEANLTLDSAPGVEFFSAEGYEVLCRQSAVAEYTEEGFAAAAVTALAVLRGAAMFHKAPGHHVTYDFTRRPHAVTALIGPGCRAFGSVEDTVPWVGLRLFDAYVRP